MEAKEKAEGKRSGSKREKSRSAREVEVKRKKAEAQAEVEAKRKKAEAQAEVESKAKIIHKDLYCNIFFLFKKNI